MFTDEELDLILMGLLDEVEKSTDIYIADIASSVISKLKIVDRFIEVVQTRTDQEV